ncbi:hypothetical protein BC629DRAFT_1524224, partial [Irpex lacteus]
MCLRCTRRSHSYTLMMAIPTPSVSADQTQTASCATHHPNGLDFSHINSQFLGALVVAQTSHLVSKEGCATTRRCHQSPVERDTPTICTM